MLLKQLADRGQGISTIAGLDREQLVELAGSSAAVEAPAESSQDSRLLPADRRSNEWVSGCLKALRKLDGAQLHWHLQEAMVLHGRQALLDTIIKPLMDQVGNLWSKGSLRIVHGQLASVVVQAQLSAMLAQTCFEAAEKPCLMVATPSGQHCYLGALAVAVIAQDHGWKPVFLGSNLPAEEIAFAYAVTAPQMIALSITCRADDGFMSHEIKRLSDFVAGRCPFVIGGQASHFYQGCIEAFGGTVCVTVKELISRFR
jgi:cobalamin-dependent methionine synthase I